jgi:hypothetical protein
VREIERFSCPKPLASGLGARVYHATVRVDMDLSLAPQKKAGRASLRDLLSAFGKRPGSSEEAMLSPL